MNTSGEFAPDWLALRESADSAARAAELLTPLRAALPTPMVVRDLGSGTGSLGRWLAGRLPGPQRWILHDRDPELLRRASQATFRDARGVPVAVQAQQVDITSLNNADFADTALVTASALLDLLTRAEVDGLATACVTARCPALLTLSVVGEVELHPADPLDAVLMSAFNAHQRRTVQGRRLLGPDAVDATTEAFEHRGAIVRTCPSPWRLGSADGALLVAWLEGWVRAACDQQPALGAEARGYLRRRRAECAAGELRVVVHHRDLLALPS
ncbi:class I SAM-dependent methyltransferase [Saccharopolyspora sp. K220]|uniref:class I SAM-dependent methyltransferase n=1 Tax=Saccharopolyspora soli TaxID=2926618 RepID=UPI001F58E1C8|nr:class I SAM-dependent methyltransferase [Saccharopolyspora soli]MCI2416046.1 class I SAM-dependent methyltransferase [Saccharopolyspora soli]